MSCLEFRKEEVEFLSEVINYYGRGMIRPLTREMVEEDSSLEEFMDMEYFNTEEYKKSLQCNSEYVFTRNGLVYTPRGVKSFIHCLKIEMGIVNEIRESGKYVEREDFFDDRISEYFFDNGIAVVQNVEVIRKKNAIEIEFNLLKHKVEVCDKRVILNETGEKLKSTLIFDFEKSVVKKINFTKDIEAFLADSCYSFWSIISAMVVIHFQNFDYSAKNIELFCHLYIRSSSNFSFKIRSLEDTIEIFKSKQDSFESILSIDFGDRDYWSKIFDFNILKLNPKEMLERFGLSKSNKNANRILKNICNVYYMKSLVELGFTNREIGFLLSSRSINQDVLESRVFKVYLKNLSKKDIVRKLTKCRNAIKVIVNIEKALSSTKECIRINTSISLLNLEEYVLDICNTVNVSSVTGVVRYNLSGIDYRKREHCVYRSEKFELCLPLDSRLFKVYGKQLNNCIGSNWKAFLDKQNCVAIIREEGSLVGAIRFNSRFEMLIEAKGYHNTELAVEQIAFVKKFCLANEMVYAEDVFYFNSQDLEIGEVV